MPCDCFSIGVSAHSQSWPIRIVLLLDRASSQLFLYGQIILSFYYHCMFDFNVSYCHNLNCDIACHEPGFLWNLNETTTHKTFEWKHNTHFIQYIDIYLSVNYMNTWRSAGLCMYGAWAKNSLWSLLGKYWLSLGTEKQSFMMMAHHTGVWNRSHRLTLSCWEGRQRRVVTGDEVGSQVAHLAHHRWIAISCQPKNICDP